MEMRIRPKSDYLHQADLKALYVLTEHWKSDISFFRDELRFLKNLVDKYFIWLINDDNIRETQSVVNDLSAAGKELQKVSIGIEEHLHQLEKLMENSFPHDEQVFRDEHAELEDAMADITQVFRLLKMQVFELTERIMQEEKIRQLLTA